MSLMPTAAGVPFIWVALPLDLGAVPTSPLRPFARDHGPLVILLPQFNFAIIGTADGRGEHRPTCGIAGKVWAEVTWRCTAKRERSQSARRDAVSVTPPPRALLVAPPLPLVPSSSRIVIQQRQDK